MPIQMLMMMMVTRAQVPFVQKGRGLVIYPHCIRKLLIRPSVVNILETYKRLTNYGIAMVITRMVRHIFLSRIPFLLIMMATSMPRK